MKKMILCSAILAFMAGCGNNEDSAGKDIANPDAPKAIDTTTQHPNGVTSDGVISTDTSIWRNQNATPDSLHK